MIRPTVLVLLLIVVSLSGCAGPDLGAPAPAPAGRDDRTVDEASAGGPEEQAAAAEGSVPAEGPPANDTAAPGASAPASRLPTTVVAIFELPNVYHHDLRRPNWTAHPSTYIPGYPEDAVPLNLTLDAGSFEEAVEADRAVWDHLEANVLYYVPGTALLGFYTPAEPGQPWTIGQHGTGVAGNIAGVRGANPDTGLVFVGRAAGELDAWEWIHANTWIDITSSSHGYVPIEPFLGATNHGVRDFAERGGLAVFAVPNQGQIACLSLPSWACDRAGAPWVVSVGRVDDPTETPVFIDGRGPLDIASVSAPCPTLSLQEHDEDCIGTSYAAPFLAGKASALLDEVRAEWGWNPCPPPELACTDGDTPDDGPLADGRLERDELLEVLYAVAKEGVREINIDAYTDTYTDQGWGYLDADAYGHASQVLWGEAPAPDRPAFIREWWERHEAFARLYWESQQPGAEALREALDRVDDEVPPE